MRDPVTTQLPVRLAADRFPDRSCLSWRAVDLELSVTCPGEAVRWGRSLMAQRHVGRWRRGSADGRLVLDVVPADAWTVVLTVSAEQPERWWASRIRDDDARAIATSLRRLLERRQRIETARTLTEVLPPWVDAPPPGRPDVAVRASGILPA